MTAGIETLRVLQDPATYPQLEARTAALEEGINEAVSRAGSGLHVTRIASLLTLFFTGSAVTDYESAGQADTARFASFFQQLLARGVYWPPSQFEAIFVSLAHSAEDIQLTAEIINQALKP
jgi:glutamate-1-semialdehyde 2,1-aminomutase